MTRRNWLWIQLAALAVALAAVEAAAIPRVAAHASRLMGADPVVAVAKAGSVLARDLTAFATTGMSWAAGSQADHPCAQLRCIRSRHRGTRGVEVRTAPARVTRGVEVQIAPASFTRAANIVVMILT